MCNQFPMTCYIIYNFVTYYKIQTVYFLAFYISISL